MKTSAYHEQFTARPAHATRRQAILVGLSIAGGLAIGVRRSDAATTLPAPGTPLAAESALRGGATALTDWVRISRDNVVTLVVSQAEMGQGISTTLPAALCDELDADWPAVRFELAPTAPAYRNPRLSWQFTGNSESMQSFLGMVRRIGATARSLLVSAAAARLGVPETALEVDRGRVLHPDSKRSLSFGELVDDAAKLPVPQNVALKTNSSLRLLGKPLPRVDGPAKANGTALFGIDYIPDGLSGVLFAAIRTAPTYGGTPVSVRNRAELEQRPGVVRVIQLPTAVAVVAQRFWQARAALAAADIEFSPGPNVDMNSAALRQQAVRHLEQGPVKVVKEHGEQTTGVTEHTATYELGFQSHVTMEPMNALANVTPEGVTVWAPTQGQELAMYAVAGVLQLRPEQVKIYRSPFLGGGFGRRLLPDFIIDAVLLSKAVGHPVKVIYSREEDIRRDSFRPATLQRLSAQIGAQGLPVAVSQRLVSPTILKPVYPVLDLSTGIDPSAIEGMTETRYNVPGWRAEFGLMELPVPTSVYRTTGFGPSIFGLECFIDELAHRGRQDPLRYRQRLLASDPRASRVLEQLRLRSNWDRPLPAGRGRGVAFTDAFGTLLGQVVEVSVKGKKLKVERIVTVADPGQVLDPEITRASLEGGAVFALSSACKGEITFNAGGPQQTNFHDYDLLRMREAPRFETHLLESPGAQLGGVGEVGPVATVPALVNALFAATRIRVRQLPLARSGFELA